MSNALTFDVRDGTAVICFTRPAFRNSLSVEVLDELYRVIDLAGEDRSIGKMYITGSEDVFASGADIREIGRLKPDEARDFATRGQQLMNRITGLGPTTIAAIN